MMKVQEECEDNKYHRNVEVRKIGWTICGAPSIIRYEERSFNDDW